VTEQIDIIQHLRSRITDLEIALQVARDHEKSTSASVRDFQMEMAKMRDDLLEARAQIVTLTRERDDARAWGIDMRDFARDLQEDLDARLPTSNTHSRKKSP
jgi:hypothetical protein